MKSTLRLTDANFKEQVSGSPIPVLVDFWASWCPPCKMMEPVIEELARELDGILTIGKINVDQNPATASELDILGVPTFILFDRGNIIQRQTGARSKQQLLSMIEPLCKEYEPGTTNTT